MIVAKFIAFVIPALLIAWFTGGSIIGIVLSILWGFYVFHSKPPSHRYYDRSRW